MATGRLSSIAAGILMSLQACALSAEIQYSLPHSERPYRLVDTLEVNIENKHRTISRKCENEGIRDIVQAMRTSTHEEAWAFLPEHCLWIEVGYDEKTGTVEETQVRRDTPYLKSLAPYTKVMHLYHFHPSRFFEQCEAGSEDCNENLVTTNPENLSKEGVKSNYTYPMPSVTDQILELTTYTSLSTIRKSLEIKEYAISPYGITKYELTSAGKRKSTKSRGQGDIIMFLAVSDFPNMGKIKAQLSANPKDMYKGLADLAENMSNEFVSFHFARLP